MHALFTSARLASFSQKRLQIIFLITFILINAILLIFSSSEEVETSNGEKYQLHAAYSQASDGQRYWGTALSLAETGQFLMRSEQEVYHRDEVLEPLSRAGPIPAILFAVPIKIFGFEKGVFFIIAGQCLLLWIMSLAARCIAELFGANKNLAQGLVLFNPNLIGVAHHAQSDLIFAFVLTLLLLNISKLIEDPSDIRVRDAITIAILAGLLPLARPIGVYCIVLLPLFLLIALLIKQRFARINWQKILGLGVISAIIAFLILTPWAVRNHAVFGELSLTQSGAIQAQYYYRALKQYGLPDSTPAAMAYLAEHNYDPLCIDSGEPGSGCEKAIRDAYMSLIFAAPKTVLLKAQSIAILRTLLSGGTRTIADYVGIPPPAEQYNLLANLSWKHFEHFFIDIYRYSPTYLIFFLAITAFPLCTRGLGLIGLLRASYNPYLHAHLVFYVLIIALLLALYGLQGWSRFRVPLEPILMVFSAIAFSKLTPQNRTES